MKRPVFVSASWLRMIDEFKVYVHVVEVQADVRILAVAGHGCSFVEEVESGLLPSAGFPRSMPSCDFS